MFGSRSPGEMRFDNCGLKEVAVVKTLGGCHATLVCPQVPVQDGEPQIRSSEWMVTEVAGAVNNLAVVAGKVACGGCFFYGKTEAQVMSMQAENNIARAELLATEATLAEAEARHRDILRQIEERRNNPTQ